MTENPLDRLNYYNGQRLEATDFRLEQAYHMRVQRWLNKSLFSAGVADGLEIERIADDRIIVHPGLALDDLGREIILLEPKEVKVEAPYLTIRYNEEKVSRTEDECNVPTGANSSTRVKWGGPSLIRAEPILEWRTRPPQNDERELIIAQFELDQFCNILKIVSGPTRYATISSISRVRTYALHGELNIDKLNPGKVYFHIRGRQPESVTLYLRAAEFSSLFYTEMGHHEHVKKLSGSDETKAATVIDPHTHAVGQLAVESGTLGDPEQDDDNETRYGYHTGKHSVWAVIDEAADPTKANWWDVLINPAKLLSDVIAEISGAPQYRPNTDDPNAPPYSLRVITRRKGKLDWVDLEENVGLKIFRGQHQHKLIGNTANPDPLLSGATLHKHELSVDLTLDPAGVTPSNDRHRARTKQPPYTYLKDIKVWIDGFNYTDQIKAQILAQYNGDPNDWSSLSASDGHPFVTNGSGPIRLDFLLPRPNLTEEEHMIEFRVDDADVGGRLLYNLYVE
jgi:hypothetical protein